MFGSRGPGQFPPYQHPNGQAFDQRAYERAVQEQLGTSGPLPSDQQDPNFIKDTFKEMLLGSSNEPHPDPQIQAAFDKINQLNIFLKNIYDNIGPSIEQYRGQLLMLDQDMNTTKVRQEHLETKMQKLTKQITNLKTRSPKTVKTVRGKTKSKTK